MLALNFFVILIPILVNIVLGDFESQKSDKASYKLLPPCPWSRWSQWSKCNCRTQVKTRTRRITKVPHNRCRIEGCAKDTKICERFRNLCGVKNNTVVTPTPNTEEARQREKWANFKRRFNKRYADLTEDERRYKIYKDSMSHVLRCKQRHPHARFGETKFSDYTNKEFSEKYVGTIIDPNSFTTTTGTTTGSPIGGRIITTTKTTVQPGQTQTTVKITTKTTAKTTTNPPTYPDTWDWRQHDAVTPVKNQGWCGSCWAFCSSASIEGAWAIQHGNLRNLSEQQLIDCSRPQGNSGCGGGWPVMAMQYTASSKGLADGMTTYPYVGTDTQSCQVPSPGTKLYAPLNTSSCYDVWSPEQIAQALYTRGPLTTLISASGSAMQSYNSGILTADETTCPSGNLDHCVAFVAMGVENGTKYWVIKNSWGPNWGENGYARLARGSNVCGCESSIVSPRVL